MDPPVVETKQGKVSGKLISVSSELTEKRCANFNAIPFAQYERLERAEPFGKWEGTLDGTGLTPRQVQNNNFIEFNDKCLGITLVPISGTPCLEMHNKVEVCDDTLHLAVYTPEDFESAKKKPVMVWIHGGAWTIGGAYEYNGAQLAAFGDVVVVAISYRLNALGFVGGNWGLWDQLEALKWVKNNISAYGGDADNVTIFGESAGSWSVEAMLSSKHTAGYFHKAIGQSGSLKTMMLDNEIAFQAKMGFTRKYFKVETDDQVKDALKAASIEEVVDFYKAFPTAQIGLLGRSGSDDFFDESFKELSTFPNKVPYMTGMNATEASNLLMEMGEENTPGLSDGWSENTFLDFYINMTSSMGGDPATVPAFVEGLKKIYSAGRDMSGQQEYSRLHNFYMADTFFLGCRDRLEAICTEQPTFHYELNVRTKAFHEEPYKNGHSKVRKDYCQTDHADDLMYVFGMMFNPDYKLPHGRYFADEEKDLSRRMIKAWSGFARTGNPGWSSFDLEKKEMMVFDTPADSIQSTNDPMMQARLKLWRGTFYH